MKLCCPEIDHVFDTDCPYVNSVVIENQRLFYRMLVDINNQLAGEDGKTVLSNQNKIIPISKNMDCLFSFVPFEMNQKGLINKATAKLENQVLSPEYYERAMKILSNLEELLLDVSVEMTGELEFSKLNIGSILKSLGLAFADDYVTLGEKLIDYMELVREYDKDKLFVTVNLRSYIDDEEAELFLQTVLQHQFKLVMLENKEYNKLEHEKRYIIDSDLCEIS